MIDERLLKSEEKAVINLRSLYRKYGYTPFRMSKFEEYPEQGFSCKRQGYHIQ